MAAPSLVRANRRRYIPISFTLMLNAPNNTLYDDLDLTIF